MLVRNVAAEVALDRCAGERGRYELHGLPRVPAGEPGRDPEGSARSKPRCRWAGWGRSEEFAAFCMPFIDETSRFTTGQFVAYAGGWA